MYSRQGVVCVACELKGLGEVGTYGQDGESLLYHTVSVVVPVRQDKLTF